MIAGPGLGMESAESLVLIHSACNTVSWLVVVKIRMLLVSTSGEAGDGQERQRRTHYWES